MPSFFLKSAYSVNPPRVEAGVFAVVADDDSYFVDWPFEDQEVTVIVSAQIAFGLRSYLTVHLQRQEYLQCSSQLQ